MLLICLSHYATPRLFTWSVTAIYTSATAAETQIALAYRGLLFSSLYISTEITLHTEHRAYNLSAISNKARFYILTFISVILIRLIHFITVQFVHYTFVLLIC